MKEHEAMVAALSKSGVEIMKEITPDKLELLHMVVGISGEAGELLDAVKKHVFYNKPLDFYNAREEMGDLEFFMEGARNKFGMTRLEILQANIEKLSVRYAAGKYSNEQAQARADKQGTT